MDDEDIGHPTAVSRRTPPAALAAVLSAALALAGPSLPASARSSPPERPVLVAPARAELGTTVSLRVRGLARRPAVPLRIQVRDGRGWRTVARGSSRRPVLVLPVRQVGTVRIRAVAVRTARSDRRTSTVHTLRVVGPTTTTPAPTGSATDVPTAAPSPVPPTTPDPADPQQPGPVTWTAPPSEPVGPEGLRPEGDYDLSDDLRWMALGTDRHLLPLSPMNRPHGVVVDLATATFQDLTPEISHHVNDVAISGNGEVLAVHTEENLVPDVRAAGLFTIDRTTGERTPVTWYRSPDEALGFPGTDPQLSWDGRRIAYSVPTNESADGTFDPEADLVRRAYWQDLETATVVCLDCPLTPADLGTSEPASGARVLGISDDGGDVLFAVTVPGPRLGPGDDGYAVRLFLWSAGRSRALPLPSTVDPQTTMLSGDGRTVVVQALDWAGEGLEIIAIDTESLASENLTASSAHLTHRLEGISRDGDVVLYEAANPAGSPLSGGLRALRRSTGALAELPGSSAYDGYRLSADGSTVAFPEDPSFRLVVVPTGV